MCGIVGILQKDNKKISQEVLIKMRDILYSRGPDDAGIWLDNNVGFGHRRLSIIDLSSLGHQPMVDEDSGARIIYNGEIYNYLLLKKELEKSGFKFKSQTDTEVILKAYRKWGKDCVKKLNGMFSFAIWDPKLRGIFLARDRMGIKPLYYYSDKSIFIFASRLGALMSHPSCPYDFDLDALGLYFEMGFVPAPWSILKGVKKVEPGHALWISNGEVIDETYWSLDNLKIDFSLEKLAESQISEKLDSLMRESVKEHLVSDVPLGAFFSGGVDSSLIVSLMRRNSQGKIKAFTIGFDDKQFDESDYAKDIAEYLGLDHYVKIMQSNDLLGLLNDNTFYYDEPFADPSSLPTIMVSRFAREHVKVCLSGDGADELFAGYHHYMVLFFLQSLYCLPGLSRLALASILNKFPDSRLKVIGQSLFHSTALEGFSVMRNINYHSIGKGIFSLGGSSIKSLFDKRSSGFPPLDKVSKATRLDMAYYLPDDILQKIDVASMSVSLEARVPFLDHRVVEFAASLPLKYKIRLGRSKLILKKVLSGYLPKNLFDRPKKGFVVPINKWFRFELKDLLLDEFSSSRIKKFGYLDPDVIKNLVELHLSNKQDTHSLLWALLCLFRWNENRKTYS